MHENISSKMHETLGFMQIISTASRVYAHKDVSQLLACISHA
jgi:hypothetical protein